MADSMLLVLFVVSYGAMAIAVCWLLWQDNQRGRHIEQMDKTLKGALESQAMICGLIQRAARPPRKDVKKSTVGKGK